MTVPQVWLSYRQPEIIARGTWDTGMFELIPDRRWWRPVDALGYYSQEDFHRLSPDDGAVVIIGAQHHHEPKYVERLNADLARLRWVVLVLAGDECSLFPWQDVQHPNMRLWIMTPRPQLHADSGAFFVGEGYRADTLDLLAGCGAEAASKTLPWAFYGQVTHARRRDLATALRRLWDRLPGDLIETPGFLQGLPRSEYLRRMAAAKVVPCPSGPGTPDSFRFYEALEAGCVPLADAYTPEGWDGYWQLVYGDDLPFPIVEDWRDVGDHIAQALDEWPHNAARCSAWWAAQKRRMAYRLDEDVRVVSR